MLGDIKGEEVTHAASFKNSFGFSKTFHKKRAEFMSFGGANVRVTQVFHY